MSTVYDAASNLQMQLNPMVKQSVSTPGYDHSTRISSLVCYICGAANANWPLYSKPSKFSAKVPFFPFLEYHLPPPAARHINLETGAVDVCTVCFSFLTQQWRAFEEKDTPIVKRLYWLKRSGSDEDAERNAEREQICIQSMSLEGNTTGSEEFQNDIQPLVSQCSSTETNRNLEVEFKTDSIQHETKETDLTNRVYDQLTESPRAETGSPFNEKQQSSPPMRAGGKRLASVEMCYVCSRQKPKEFMRSVHTRAQLKTETPFYPCLSKHVPAAIARKMDYLGRVLVCEACQKFLFRQWQVFQKNNTPLSERQYQLRSDPSLPREQQSQLSTMVCFICGVTQPATSGRFLYSQPHAPGDPFYPFLNNLTPPPGAMPLTKQGLTRACSGCRKSLHRQWKQFEADGMPEEQREYRIRNEPIMIPIPSSTAVSSVTDLTTTHKSDNEIVCYTCAELFAEGSMRPIYTKMDTNPLKGSFCFPFIALLQPPQGCKPIDHMGQTFVCKRCFRFLQNKWEQFESEKVPHHMRIYAVNGRGNIRLKAKRFCCFLCGFLYEGNSPWKLYSCPQSRKGIIDGGPFFPFLSHREPKKNADPIDSEGGITVCEICFTNLMDQWQSYENSIIPAESNRWLRKYRFNSVVCYLCGVHRPREDCTPVTRQLARLLPSYKVPKGSLIMNKNQDVVVCVGCRDSVTGKNMNSIGEGIKVERSFTSAGGRPTDEQLSAQGSSTLSNKFHKRQDKSIIVIDSSDSEGDDSTFLRQQGSHSSAPVTGHGTTSPMHYTASPSPGIQTSSSQSKDQPVSVSPSSGMQPSTSRSFAAALRKLAKQAMPPGSGPSPPSSSASGSKPGSPTISHGSSRSTGMSPSRTSPAASSTPPVSRVEPPHPVERLAHGSDKELHSIATPPMPPIPALDTDHRNQNTGDDNRIPSQGSHRPKLNPSPHPAAHEVLPGVFATRPGYPPDPAPMLSEHYPGDHAHHAVPYYLQGGKPDLPLFVPRAGPMPGPPPLLASKRDGPDAHAVSPFYPAPFPPGMMDSADLHFETWRQRRAVEHLRQQHERHDSFLRPPHEDLASPKEPPTENEQNDSAGPPGESREHVPMMHRMYYYDNNKPPSCPVHGHGTTPDGQHQHSHPPPPPPRPEPIPPGKPDRPEEFNRMFLPPRPDGAAMLHPFLMHPSSRDGPFGAHHIGERQVEMMRERERQELLLHQRLMLDQQEQMKAREDEWQRRHQQQLRQDKNEHQREVMQYRHQVLQHQQREMEQPHRLDQIGMEHRRLEKTSKSPSSGEHPPSEQAHDKDVFRRYPFHPAFHPPHGGQPYSDHHRKEGEPPRHPLDHHKGGPPPNRIPYSFHSSHFPSDGFPFRHEGIVTSVSGGGRMFTDSDWPRHGRPIVVNGDLRIAELEMRRKMSPGLRIKAEKTEDGMQINQPMRMKHDQEKLKFLEGLGLVTMDRKKELAHGDPSLKRKFEETPVVAEAERQEKRNGESSSGRKEEVEETSSEGTSEGESGTGTSTDTDVTSQQYAEKVEFFARLGLVPPHTRQEMEQSYEVKRSERKKRRRKGRGRPSKRPRREDEENSENGRSPIDFGGPLTRQKQQQLKELQAQVKNKPEESNGEKSPAIKIKTERKDEPEPPYMFDRPDGNYRSRSRERYEAPTSDPMANRPPPRLTLSSLTNMEDPFTNYEASTFRPPYLRHTGLLSVSQDSMHADARLNPECRPTAPVRPEPVRSTGMSLSEKETRDYLTRRSSPSGATDFGRHFGTLAGQQGSSFEKLVPGHPPHSSSIKDAPSERKEGEYRWPGVESVMKAYLLHNGDRQMEMSFLQDNATMLKSHHVSLNEEASALSMQMTNLVQTKRQLVEEKKAYREDLDRLHYFMQSFQR